MRFFDCSVRILTQVKPGQQPFLPFPNISIFRPVFGPHEATHENEPTVSANEDLVGTNSFQDVCVCASVCGCVPVHVFP